MIYPSGTYWLANRFDKLSPGEADAEICYIHELLKQGCNVTLYPNNSRYDLPDEGRWPFCRKSREGR